MKNILLLLLLLPQFLLANNLDKMIFGERVEGVVYFEYKDFEMSQIRGLDLDLLGINLDDNTAHILGYEGQIEALKKMGLNFVEKKKNYLKRIDREYKTPSEIEVILKKYATKYSEIAKMQSIGKSSEGRDIWALKISDNAHLTEPDEPKVLFNSMHHARELMSPEASLDIIETLLSKYHSNKTVTHWVDANEIWVVPMLNVDGNAKVWSGSTMWRKNTNHGHGVDINRNYPYKWNSCNGSSGAIWSSTYRGASGGSEPETQALMNLVKATRPVFSISYHSYSQIVLYPQGCKGERSFNTEVVEKIGHQIAEKIGYTAGTPWELLYSVDGGDIDWMHAEYQVIPYVLELNSSREGFQPNYQMWRDKTMERTRGGWQLLLERLDGPGVRGRLNVGDYIVKVMRDGLTITTYSGNVDGTFHIVLDPGEYELNFSSNQFENFKKVVIIEDKRIDL